MISFLCLLGIGIVETHPHPSTKGEKFKAMFHIGSAFLFFGLNIGTNSYWAYICKFISKNPLDTRIIIHIWLTLLSIIIFFLVFITSALNLWFLSINSPISFLESLHSKSGLIGIVARFLVVPINNDITWCIIKAEYRQKFSFNRTRITRRHSIDLESGSEDRQRLLFNEARITRKHSRDLISCNCLKRRKIVLFCFLNYVFEIMLIFCAVSGTMLHSAIKNQMLPFLSTP